MRLADDVEHFWRFWSVRLGLLSGACSAAAGAYAACNALAPKLVEGVPQWTLTALVLGAMVFAFAGVIARGIDQPKLRPDPTDQAGA